uniref:Uncharacterized protein n=1 Tax=Glycine max TaxID=3847 RepID=C6TKN2_SOYBN|nr:unknown [Glycine max]
MITGELVKIAQCYPPCYNDWLVQILVVHNVMIIFVFVNQMPYTVEYVLPLDSIYLTNFTENMSKRSSMSSIFGQES